MSFCRRSLAILLAGACVLSTTSIPSKAIDHPPASFQRTGPFASQALIAALATGNRNTMAANPFQTLYRGLGSRADVILGLATGAVVFGGGVYALVKNYMVFIQHPQMALGVVGVAVIAMTLTATSNDQRQAIKQFSEYGLKRVVPIFQELDEPDRDKVIKRIEQIAEMAMTEGNHAQEVLNSILQSLALSTFPRNFTGQTRREQQWSEGTQERAANLFTNLVAKYAEFELNPAAENRPSETVLDLSLRRLLLWGRLPWGERNAPVIIEMHNLVWPHKRLPTKFSPVLHSRIAFGEKWLNDFIAVMVHRGYGDLLIAAFNRAKRRIEGMQDSTYSSAHVKHILDLVEGKIATEMSSPEAVLKSFLHKHGYPAGKLEYQTLHALVQATPAGRRNLLADHAGDWKLQDVGEFDQELAVLVASWQTSIEGYAHSPATGAKFEIDSPSEPETQAIEAAKISSPKTSASRPRTRHVKKDSDPLEVDEVINAGTIKGIIKGFAINQQQVLVDIVQTLRGGEVVKSQVNIQILAEAGISVSRLTQTVRKLVQNGNISEKVGSQLATRLILGRKLSKQLWDVRQERNEKADFMVEMFPVGEHWDQIVVVFRGLFVKAGEEREWTTVYAPRVDGSVVRSTYADGSKYGESVWPKSGFHGLVSELDGLFHVKATDRWVGSRFGEGKHLSPEGTQLAYQYMRRRGDSPNKALFEELLRNADWERVDAVHALMLLDLVDKNEATLLLKQYRIRKTTRSELLLSAFASAMAWQLHQGGLFSFKSVLWMMGALLIYSVVVCVLLLGARGLWKAVQSLLPAMSGPHLDPATSYSA